MLIVWDIIDYRRLIHLDVLIRHSIARVLEFALITSPAIVSRMVPAEGL